MKVKPSSIDKIVESGAFVAEPVNIRGGHSSPPYNWGPGAGYSHILKELGISDGQGNVTGPDRLERLGLDRGSIAERWYHSDDALFPSRMKIDGAEISLNAVIEANPELALGREHVRAFGPAMGMIMKDLDAAEPLSWQMHIGIEEGIEVQEMPEGTGLLLGPAEPGSDEQRLRILRNVRSRIAMQDSRVLRLIDPAPGIETHPSFKEGDLKSYLDGLTARITDDLAIPQLLRLLLEDGINAIDVLGFSQNSSGLFEPEQSLVQMNFPKPGDCIVTRERMPHALFGAATNLGPGAIAWVTEFKQTGLASSQSQTWSLADNIMGKMPRPGKVSRKRLDEAFKAMAGYSWRAQSSEDFRPSHEDSLRAVAPGAFRRRVHLEPGYAALKMRLDSRSRAVLKRFGRHSALAVRRGMVRVSDLQNSLIIDRLGFDGRGWDGSCSDEAVVLAHRGDLLIESIGSEPAVLYDAVRPIPGEKNLPDLFPL